MGSNENVTTFECVCLERSSVWKGSLVWCCTCEIRTWLRHVSSSASVLVSGKGTEISLFSFYLSQHFFFSLFCLFWPHSFGFWRSLYRAWSELREPSQENWKNFRTIIISACSSQRPGKVGSVQSWCSTLLALHSLPPQVQSLAVSLRIGFCLLVGSLPMHLNLCVTMNGHNSLWAHAVH